MVLNKFGIEVEAGYGILTKNPTIVSDRDFEFYRKLIWVKYEDHWLTLKKKIDIVDLYSFLNSSKTKEEYINNIESLI